MSNHTDNAFAARILNQEVQSFVPTSSLAETIDCRGRETITVMWSSGSSCHSARLSRVLTASATEHGSTGNWDLMTVAGSSGGAVSSTTLDWPFIFLTSTTSGSTASVIYVGLR